jgi:DNA-binding XRE family transcriptional regulator
MRICFGALENCVRHEDICIQCNECGRFSEQTEQLTLDELFKDTPDEEYNKHVLLAELAVKMMGWRLDNDMTQEDLAKKLGISQKLVSALEGCNADPTIEDFGVILGKLGMRVNKIDYC